MNKQSEAGGKYVVAKNLAVTFGSNIGRPLTAIGYQWTLILNGCCERLAYKFVLTGKLKSRKGHSARQLTHQTSIVDFNHDEPGRKGLEIRREVRKAGHCNKGACRGASNQENHKGVAGRDCVAECGRRDRSGATPP